MPAPARATKSARRTPSGTCQVVTLLGLVVWSVLSASVAIAVATRVATLRAVVVIVVEAMDIYDKDDEDAPAVADPDSKTSVRLASTKGK